MSLESQIAALVNETNGLLTTFNNKNKDINAAVAAAIAAVPSNSKSFYVNPLMGDDSAAGTAAAPLKTIEKAIANTPAGGVVMAYLQTDYVFPANITVDSRFLHIRSDVSGTKRKIISNYYAANSSAETYLAGLVMANGAQVMVTDLTLQLPSPAGFIPAPVGFTNSFFKTSSWAGTVIAAVKLTACEVTATADFAGWIFGSPNSAIVFEVLSVTFPSNFGGRYVHGVASGTNPATLTNILTNLSAL